MIIYNFTNKFGWPSTLNHVYIEMKKQKKRKEKKAENI